MGMSQRVVWMRLRLQRVGKPGVSDPGVFLLMAEGQFFSHS